MSVSKVQIPELSNIGFFRQFIQIQMFLLIHASWTYTSTWNKTLGSKQLKNTWFRFVCVWSPSKFVQFLIVFHAIDAMQLTVSYATMYNWVKPLRMSLFGCSATCDCLWFFDANNSVAWTCFSICKTWTWNRTAKTLFWTAGPHGAKCSRVIWRNMKL